MDIMNESKQDGQTVDGARARQILREFKFAGSPPKSWYSSISI